MRGSESRPDTAHRLQEIASHWINTFMASQLTIQSLYDATWNTYGPDYLLTIANREHVRSEINRRLGQEMASEIQRHVDVALKRIQAAYVPNPRIMKPREFYDLLAMEMGIQELECRIKDGCIFVDGDDLLPTLALSWWDDVLPLLQGQENPGYMPVKNVKRFLEMVRGADQRLPSGDQNSDITDHFQGKRRELTGFLERAVRMGEAVWCNL